MKRMHEAFTCKLQEIVNLQAELQLQEDKYASFKKANESHEVLKETLLTINRLKAQLKEKEADALTLFN